MTIELTNAMVQFLVAATTLIYVGIGAIVCIVIIIAITNLRGR